MDASIAVITIENCSKIMNLSPEQRVTELAFQSPIIGWIIACQILFFFFVLIYGLTVTIGREKPLIANHRYYIIFIFWIVTLLLMIFGLAYPIWIRLFI